MQSVFSFDWVILFGFLSAMLLIGIFLRAKISFIQKFLFPSCMIGGLLGLILVNTLDIGIPPSSFESIAFHLFTISFISVGLTKDDTPSPDGKRAKGFWSGALWMALVQGVCFPLQAIIGAASVAIFGFFGVKLFKTFGFLAPLAFNEGPGQALSIGKSWETVGFAHGGTLGLTFASIGIFFALFVGVSLAKWGVAKGLPANTPKELPREFYTGVMPKGAKLESAGELTMHSANVDALAFQTALVGAVYLITYFFVKLLGSRLSPDVGKMLWGVTFVFGLGVSLLVKLIMSKLGIDYLIDPGVQRRVTGWSMDFLIVAAVSAIQMSVVWQFFLPVVLTSLAVGILTTIVTVLLGRRLKNYNIERIVAIYGVVTGTLANGLLLLRMVDPDFKTPVAYEMAVMNIFVAPIIYVCILLVNAPLWWGWSMPLTLALFAVMMIISFALIRLFIAKWEPKF